MKANDNNKMNSKKIELQEANWKSYFDDFYQSIAITDMTGRHLYVNKAYCKLTGYSYEEFMELNIRDLVDPKVLKELYDRIKNRLTDGSLPYTSQLEIIRKDGTRIDIEAHGHKILMGDQYVDMAAISTIIELKREENWIDTCNKIKDQLDIVFSTELCFKIICNNIEKAGFYKRSVIVSFDEWNNLTKFGSNGLDDLKIPKELPGKALTNKQLKFLEQDKFKINRSFFIPDNKINDILDISKIFNNNLPETSDLTNWQPGDFLLVPLFSEHKTTSGLLIVDTPVNGKRPDLKTVKKLEDLLEMLSRRLNEIKHQEKIFESGQKYRAITEQSILPIAIFMKDRYTYVNPAFCELSGYSKSEILKWDIQESRKLIHPEDLKLVLDHDKMFKSKNFKANSIIVRGINKSGEVKWLERYANNFIHENQDSLMVILIDRTEKMILEEDLQKSEDRIRGLINATHDAVILCDIKGNLLDLNETFARRFHRSRKSLLGTNVWDLFPPEIVETRKNNLKKLLKTKKMITMSDTREGIVNRTNIFPIFDREGNINRIAIFARDITDEVESARRLRDAEKLAAIGNLAAGIVHQIRNPLGNISFAAQLSLQQKNVKDPVKEYLELILKDTEHANEVIMKLNEYSNPKEIILKPSNILEPILKAISFSKARLEAKNINLKFNHPKKLPLINMSQYWIEQVVINIINNSIQAISENGKIIIDVEKLKGNEIKIQLKDNGCGIHPTKLGQVFDPFFSTKHDGVGLGLRIACKIIELHKGSVSIDSTEGKFTIIVLKLPFKKQKTKSDKMMMIPL